MNHFGTFQVLDVANTSLSQLPDLRLNALKEFNASLNQVNKTFQRILTFLTFFIGPDQSFKLLTQIRPLIAQSFDKEIDLPGRANDPSSGKILYHLFFPATPLSQSWTLEGLFELIDTLQWPSTLPRVLPKEL